MSIVTGEEEAPRPPEDEEAATLEATRQVACPECGQPAMVTLNRRQSADFCVRCDFPLFWTPSDLLLADGGTGDSLRRLPGAEGRQQLGSATCPTCAELNLITAEICVRCGGLMRLPLAAPVAAPAPPPPPLAAPEPEPEPEDDRFWIWVSIAGGIALAVLIALLAYLALR